ncbi:MAG: bifunctional pyr operon transcriptional regulator/uracil phosphoribosyltransferase PyrR [Nitrospinae bacterium]|nr:bifunctional pyr operon transcriptional regulator/uracil phosphoribosyltransferase PyrR [Nitrospinota bacterium]
MSKEFSNIIKVIGKQGIQEIIAKLSGEIIKDNKNLNKVVIVGIRTRGEFIAKRIVKEIKRIKGIDLANGTLDITLYRDDVIYNHNIPVVKETHMPFLTADGLKGLTVILIDDVLFTGRTIRSALDALTDMGRASKIRLGVLVNRGHHELPIAADYIGLEIKTKLKDSVRVNLMETDKKEEILHKEK